MTHIVRFLFLASIIVLILSQCAVEAEPLGGPKDEIPPSPILEESTTNYQTNFVKQDIILTFDEWVVVKNASAQIAVSPPLVTKMKARTKGKKVILSFDEDEVLKEDVTYTINMGEAIVDFTEANPMDNFSFVFSTGDILDSLRLTGTVIDDFTGEPVPDVLVLMYEDLSDTAFTTHRPFYFSKTNKEGNFKLENLKSDTFQIYTLIDKNVSYFKDQSSESIGFIDNYIILTDTFNQLLRLPIFLPEQKLQLFSEQQKNYGKLTLLFNREPYDVNFRFEPENLNYKQFIVKDSLFIYYENELEDRIMILEGGDKQDTVSILARPVDYEAKSKMTIKQMNGLAKGSFSIKDTLQVEFNKAIKTMDANQIAIRDTAGMELKFDVKVANENPKELKIVYPWKELVDYELTFLPGAVLGFDESVNDTIVKKFTPFSLEKFGEIILQLDSLDQTQSYILEMTSRNYYRKFIVEDVEQKTIVIPSLKPGQYALRFILDENKNHRWDSGKLEGKIKSERWKDYTLDALKADWTLEVKISGDGI